MGNTWITIVVCAACGVDGGDRTVVASNALGGSSNCSGTDCQSVFPDVTGTCTYNSCLNGVPAEVSGSGGTPSDPWGYPDT